VVRLILALKINALARGHSGTSMRLIEALAALLQHEIYPVIPAQARWARPATWLRSRI